MCHSIRVMGYKARYCILDYSHTFISDTRFIIVSRVRTGKDFYRQGERAKERSDKLELRQETECISGRERVRRLIQKRGASERRQARPSTKYDQLQERIENQLIPIKSAVRIRMVTVTQPIYKATIVLSSLKLSFLSSLRSFLPSLSFLFFPSRLYK